MLLPCCDVLMQVLMPVAGVGATVQAGSRPCRHGSREQRDAPNRGDTPCQAPEQRASPNTSPHPVGVESLRQDILLQESRGSVVTLCPWHVLGVRVSLVTSVAADAGPEL